MGCIEELESIDVGLLTGRFRESRLIAQATLVGCDQAMFVQLVDRR